MYRRQGGTTLQVAGGIILAVFFFVVVLPCAGLGGCAWLISSAGKPSVSNSDYRAPADRSRQRRSSANEDTGVRAAGHQFAKKVITPALKAPSSADFPWESVSFTKLTPLTDPSGASAKRWRVRGAVDALNSFGAKLRSNWEVIVLDMGSDFIAGEARLDDQLVFQLDSYRALLDLTPQVSTHLPSESEANASHDRASSRTPSSVQGGACAAWGKPEDYIAQLESDYRYLKDAGQLTRADMLPSALDACSDRVGSQSELELCRTCVNQIIDAIFGTSPQSSSPSVEKKSSEPVELLTEVESTEAVSTNPPARVLPSMVDACRDWAMSDRYLRRLKTNYESRRDRRPKESALKAARAYCSKRPQEEFKACMECMEALVETVYFR